MELDENANILMDKDINNAQPPSYSSSSKIPPLSPISIKESRRTTTNSNNKNGDYKILLPIGRIYGSGLGYGLRTTLGVHGRADGVAVYLKRQATLILGIIIISIITIIIILTTIVIIIGNILGSVVFGGGSLRSWEDRLNAMKKVKAENDNTNITDTPSSNNYSSITATISKPPPLKYFDDSDIKLRSSGTTNGSIKVKVTEESQRASISRLLESSDKKSTNVDAVFSRTFIRYHHIINPLMFITVI